jgi:bifunctional non-homologous end joining protein LigD
MQHLAGLVIGVYPGKTTVERAVAKRTGKIYLDYLQNARGRTMAFQYSLRPLPGAPVSTPLLWEEVESRQVRPGDYNIKTVFQRIEKYGDLLAGIKKHRRPLAALLKAAGYAGGEGEGARRANTHAHP